MGGLSRNLVWIWYRLIGAISQELIEPFIYFGLAPSQFQAATAWFAAGN